MSMFPPVFKLMPICFNVLCKIRQLSKFIAKNIPWSPTPTKRSQKQWIKFAAWWRHSEHQPICKYVWSVSTRVASICANLLDQKKKGLDKKRVQLPEDWFGTPIWPPWRYVKTLYIANSWFCLAIRSTHVPTRVARITTSTTTTTTITTTTAAAAATTTTTNNNNSNRL